MAVRNLSRLSDDDLYKARKSLWLKIRRDMGGAFDWPTLVAVKPEAAKEWKAFEVEESRRLGGAAHKYPGIPRTAPQPNPNTAPRLVDVYVARFEKLLASGHGALAEARHLRQEANRAPTGEGWAVVNAIAEGLDGLGRVRHDKRYLKLAAELRGQSFRPSAVKWGITNPGAAYHRQHAKTHKNLASDLQPRGETMEGMGPQKAYLVGFHRGKADAHEESELASKVAANPKRPTKSFMKRCVPGVGPGYDAGAVCASTWRKMKPGAKKKWLARENPGSASWWDGVLTSADKSALKRFVIRLWPGMGHDQVFKMAVGTLRKDMKFSERTKTAVGDYAVHLYLMLNRGKASKNPGPYLVKLVDITTGLPEDLPGAHASLASAIKAAKYAAHRGFTMVVEKKTGKVVWELPAVRHNPTFHESSEVEFIETKYPGPNYQKLLEAGYRHISTSNGYAKMVPGPEHNPGYGFGLPGGPLVSSGGAGVVRSIRLQAESYFGGVQIVQIGESGWKVVSDSRKTKDGYLFWTATPPIGRPSEKLRAVLAKHYIGDRKPVTAPLSQPVLMWAFPGMTADEVSKKYMGGIPVYLANPGIDPVEGAYRAGDAKRRKPEERSIQRRYKCPGCGKVSTEPGICFGCTIKKNPGDPAQADIAKIRGFKPEMLQHPDFMPALRKYIEFHGCMPESLTKVNINLGTAAKGETTFLAHMGKAPEVSYQTTNPKSNKAGSRWIHEFCEDMKKKDIKQNDLPDLACTADGKAIITVGGRFEVKDWVRK